MSAMSNSSNSGALHDDGATSMNIAIFGDLHGRVLLAFHLIDLWQRHTGASIDYALSVGDIGIYRSIDNMEKTSRRFAEKYPEELGFSKFFWTFDTQTHRIEKHPTTSAVLDRSSADLLFLPGNHEEHGFLCGICDHFAVTTDTPVAVDVDWQGLSDGLYDENQFHGHARLHLLPQGRSVDLPGPLDETTWAPLYSCSLLALNGLDRYTRPDSWGLAKTCVDIDIMLTHETYRGRLEGFDKTGRRDAAAGSERLLSTIKRVSPKYHFFGHHHWYYPEVELRNQAGSATKSVGLNQVHFVDRTAAITRGCFGVLKVNSPHAMAFHIVDEPWFTELTYSDCRGLL